jgi:hypothetical protein
LTYEGEGSFFCNRKPSVSKDASAKPIDNHRRTVREGSQAAPDTPASLAQVRSPFVRVALPEDHITIAGQRFYTVTTLARHLGISKAALHVRLNAFTFQPGLRNGKKLIAEDEVRRVLEGR